MLCLNLLYIETIIFFYISFDIYWNNTWPFFISLGEKKDKSSIRCFSLLSSLHIEDRLLNNHWFPFLLCLADISYYLDLGLFLPFIIASVYLLFNYSSSFFLEFIIKKWQHKRFIGSKNKSTSRNYLFSLQVPLMRWLTEYRVLDHN